jgi:predicted RND superfamily exporter protein
MKHVKVNYDLSSYIPNNMPSKEALDITTEEFGMQSTARVMINNISLAEAKRYKEEISEVDGVYQVLWIDDIDVYQPYEFIENQDISKYYKDSSALFDIMFYRVQIDYIDLQYSQIYLCTYL